MSETKRPQSIDDLVDEALEGFENLLCPITYRAVRNFLSTYARVGAATSSAAVEAVAPSRPGSWKDWRTDQAGGGVFMPPPRGQARTSDIGR